MPETPDRIIKQLEADTITGTDNSTRRRMEKKGAFPLRFQITENGATGYLLSEVLAWIETRTGNQSPPPSAHLTQPPLMAAPQNAPRSRPQP